ncbi:MAG: GntR family transcriptional regulator [Phycisphaeraceae bacterium]|nr:GntR family transcriptional regulator [Phycisphaeraceae bacterium]
MSKLLQTVEFAPHWPVQGQIRKLVRRMVESGELEPGERLPSTQVLAKHWNTDVRTVHFAMLPLVRQGLLTRVSRVGTFVRRREAKLSRIAIYMKGEQFGAMDGPLHLALMAELQKLMRERDIQPDIWIDPRPLDERHMVWPALEQAIQERRIHALIVPQASPDIMSWIPGLSVPVAVFASGEDPFMVNLDNRQAAILGIQALRDQGCRSVSLMIGAKSRNALDPSGRTHALAPFLQQFDLSAEEAQLVTRSEWMMYYGPIPGTATSVDYEAFGYEAFRRLWSMPHRPDGLLLIDNVIAKGVIAAMLQLQVEPEQLKVVTTKLAHVRLFSPVPITCILVDDRAIAEALLTQVEKQFNGEPCQTIYVSPRMAAPHEGCVSPHPIQEMEALTASS